MVSDIFFQILKLLSFGFQRNPFASNIPICREEKKKRIAFLISLRNPGEFLQCPRENVDFFFSNFFLHEGFACLPLSVIWCYWILNFIRVCLAWFSRLTFGQPDLANQSVMQNRFIFRALERRRTKKCPHLVSHFGFKKIIWYHGTRLRPKI